MNKNFKVLVPFLIGIILTGHQCNLNAQTTLPRGEASEALQKGVKQYLDYTYEKGINLHSLMIVKDGKVVAEKWVNGARADYQHIQFSASKSFTATAVGIAAAEKKLKLSDKVISFFPDKLPEKISENLAAMTVEDLLTMSCGHDRDHTRDFFGAPNDKPDYVMNKEVDWVKQFLSYPVEHKPGTYFKYNTAGSFMLSAIVQKATGEKMLDYMKPRFFDPLGIENPTWIETPEGYTLGGCGLYVKTEDMAKFGLVYLNNGKWNGKRILTEKWVKDASRTHIETIKIIEGKTVEESRKIQNLEENNWAYGYSYQMKGNPYGGYRADGMKGQFIIMLPEKNAVIVATAFTDYMAEEIEGFWKYILPAL